MIQKSLLCAVVEHLVMRIGQVACVMVLWSVTCAASADAGDTAVVSAQVVAPVIRAYAQVVPVAELPIRAMATGRVADLHILPGAGVAAGQVLAHLDGSQMRAWLVSHRQAWVAAQAAAASAAKVAAVTRQQLADHLVTQQQLAVAERDLLAARSAERTAHAQWQDAQNQQTVSSPVAGTVQAVQAANDENIQSGQILITILSDKQLWIRAAVYGRDVGQIRLGMAARFVLSDGQTVIPARVVSIAAQVAPDGSTQVGLLPVVPMSSIPWRAGQWGQVAFTQPAQQLLMIPTMALVLDSGRWWVVLHTPKGDRPQPVVPGEAQGWQTCIVSGLKPGQQIVTRNAFLVFHQDIANNYQQPD